MRFALLVQLGGFLSHRHWWFERFQCCSPSSFQTINLCLLFGTGKNQWIGGSWFQWNSSTFVGCGSILLEAEEERKFGSVLFQNLGLGWAWPSLQKGISSSSYNWKVVKSKQWLKEKIYVLYVYPQKSGLISFWSKLSALVSSCNRNVAPDCSEKKNKYFCSWTYRNISCVSKVFGTQLTIQF